MRRRLLLISLLALLYLFILGANRTVSSEQINREAAAGDQGGRAGKSNPGGRRPNIVLIVADDLGYGDLQCYGRTEARTPVLNEMAQNGVRFTDFNVCALCAPSRSSLLTGVYSMENGMWRGPSETKAREDRNYRGIREGIRLLPQFLHEAGYATGMYGKWHLGYEAPDLPNDRGFDDFVGFLGGSCPYDYAGAGDRILRNGAPYRQKFASTTDLFTDEAVGFIVKNADKPFFLYIPVNAVHGPLWSTDRPKFSAAEEWRRLYEDLPADRRDYAATLSHLDASVGRIMDALADQELTGRTMVIFTSDNGACLMTGETEGRFPGNNGPFRNGKGSVYNGGITVPLIIQWPGVVPGGAVADGISIHADLFTTILDAVGLPVPKVNGSYPVVGLSLLEYMRAGGKIKMPDRCLFWELAGKFAVRRGQWKLVGETAVKRADYEAMAAEIAAGTYELYDLRTDPGEKKNLAAAFPEIHDRLKGEFVEYLAGVVRRKGQGGP